MASVYRKTYTHPPQKKLPKHAELVERRGQTVAKWIDRAGRTRYDPVTLGRDGQPRLQRQSPTYTARYRDADGVERFVSTGSWPDGQPGPGRTGSRSTDEQAANQVLADLVRRTEHVKAGILTPPKKAE